MENALATAGNGDLIGQAYFAMVDRQMLDEADEERVKGILSGVFALIDQHHLSSVGIKSDTDLSVSGRDGKLAALVKRNDERLIVLTKNIVAELEAKTQTATSRLASAVDVEPTLADVQLMIERRVLWREVDPLMRSIKLLELASNGSDDLSVMAVLSAPSLAPICAADTAEKARAIMGARRLPDAAKELQEARETLTIFQNALQRATDAFASRIERASLGLVGDDPLAMAARGNAVA